jgi:hypothetical protein
MWVKFTSGDFVRFEPVTLIPFETKLIDFGMMSTAQIEWFNDYNVKIREEVATVLQVIKLSCHLRFPHAFKAIYVYKYTTRRFIESLWASIKVITISE